MESKRRMMNFSDYHRKARHGFSVAGSGEIAIS